MSSIHKEVLDRVQLELITEPNKVWEAWVFSERIDAYLDEARQKAVKYQEQLREELLIGGWDGKSW